MTRHFVLACGLAVIVGAGVASAAEDPLDTAKTLYLSASYEEALTALTNLPANVDADQADKFRALCFLALNRTQDAAETLERLATRKPMLKLDEGESPKLVLMFQEARARVLPAAARTMYANAKSTFERGDLKSASTQFRDVISLLSDKDLAAQPAFADMKMLAEGFGKLVDQQLVAERQAAAAAPPTPPPAPVAAAPAPSPADALKVYSSADDDVVPPIPIVQTIPAWIPPNGSYRFQEYTGLLEVVIDETGLVSSATMVQKLNVLYDQTLLSATKRWRYRPAQRAGKPVKYRKQVNVVLRPAPQGTASPQTVQPQAQ